MLSPKSAGLAKKSGYEKVRVYLDGEPEWKKAELPLESSLAFVEKGNIVLIDLRSPEKVAAGHIPGAVGIPAADLAAAQAKFPAYRGAHLVFYSDSAEDLSQALELARDWNYKNATIFPGGIGAWQKAGKHLKTGAAAATVTYVKKLAPGEVGTEDFQAALKDGRTVVIDARAPGEFEKGHFKGAVNIPAEEAAKRLAEIPADRPVLVHCSTGTRAEMVYDLVKDKGYNLKYLKAGVEFAADGSYTISE